MLETLANTLSILTEAVTLLIVMIPFFCIMGVLGAVIYRAAIQS